MARVPSMTPHEAETAIKFPRGKLRFVGSEIRPFVKKWLSAMGVPSAHVAYMSGSDMVECYNDLSGAAIAAQIAMAADKEAEDSADAVVEIPVLPPMPVDDPNEAREALLAALAALEAKRVEASKLIAAPVVAPTPTVPAIPMTPVLPPMEKPLAKAMASHAVIPPVVDAGDFTTTNDMQWDDLLMQLTKLRGVVNRVLLYGPPRTGKSTSAANIFSQEGKPSERITFHKQQPIDDLLGGYTLRDGSTVWSDGPAIRAMRTGSTLVIDEIDQFSAECRFTCHALMDDPPGVTLSSGERVMAAPGFMVVATTNAPPSSLPLPILDRFDLILYCGTISKGLRAKLGKLADAGQRSVAKMACWTRPASPNLLLAAAKLHAAGIDASHIARLLYPGQENEQTDLLTLLAVSK